MDLLQRGQLELERRRRELAELRRPKNPWDAVADNVLPIGNTPATERQARPLTRLELPNVADSVRVYPSLATAALETGRAAEYRLYLLMLALDPGGQRLRRPGAPA